MIFGNKLAVSGAREPELLAGVIDRVVAMAGESQDQTAEADELEDDEEEDSK